MGKQLGGLAGDIKAGGWLATELHGGAPGLPPSSSRHSPKVVQVPGYHQAVAAVVARAGDDEHARVRAAGTQGRGAAASVSTLAGRPCRRCSCSSSAPLHPVQPPTHTRSALPRTPCQALPSRRQPAARPPPGLTHLTGYSVAAAAATLSPASSISWSTLNPRGPISSSSSSCAWRCVLQPGRRAEGGRAAGVTWQAASGVAAAAAAGDSSRPAYPAALPSA